MQVTAYIFAEMFKRKSSAGLLTLANTNVSFIFSFLSFFLVGFFCGQLLPQLFYYRYERRQISASTGGDANVNAQDQNCEYFIALIAFLGLQFPKALPHYISQTSQEMS